MGTRHQTDAQAPRYRGIGNDAEVSRVEAMHHTMMAIAAASFMGCSVIGCPITTQRVLRFNGYVNCKIPSSAKESSAHVDDHGGNAEFGR